MRLDATSMNGNYFGAYENHYEDAKRGHVVFLSSNDDADSYCECSGFEHRKTCYHLKGAKVLEERLFE